MIATLYAVSIAVLTIYGGNLLWMAVCFARRDTLRTGEVPEPNDLPPPPESWPDVTVQLPLFNEPFVAERLIDACAELDYPRGHLEIQVLDDSTDATCERVAERVAFWQKRNIDINHIRRAHRQDYKAGALQNGLQLARGTFIGIFDADFLPTPDFLLRTIPRFDDPQIGVVQTRWGHLNLDASLLTKVQAIGLDAHFAVEQQVRRDQGCYLNFNGTAGVWRRACIEDSGGWQGDTIAEDFDLSYRAQLRGWRFRFLGDVEVPAELPVTMGALRSQQFRWAKGSVETARKLLRPLLASDANRRIKLQGVIHLTAHFVFPFILLATLLHAPLLILSSSGAGPGPVYFGLMSFGLVGFAGFVLVQVFAQRDLYPHWRHRLRVFPAFMAGTIGLSLHNSKAVLEAMLGKRSAFVRTPKFNVVPGLRASAGAAPHSFRQPSPPIAWLELILFFYSVGGLALLIAAGEWVAAPFQTIFAAGFGLVTLATFSSRGL
jgi:cellulose synthase/poly-beta-1,6-N-acetylglucosamine synthase-like glycosyltransferase